MLKKLFTGWLLCSLSFTAQAGGVEKLKSFISATRSGQANFTQTVLDRNGKKTQSASGTMQFVRPGKFRWSYQKPYEQLIVGDGAKFWMYDVDLNQASVKKLDQALGSSPAALLAGSNEIERGFVLKDTGSKDALDWLEAAPRNRDTSFENIRMAFDAQGDLAVMELSDAFGNHTVLRFSGLQRNPALSPGLFKFSPPKGADVIGGE